jgi:hypothetical protein
LYLKEGNIIETEGKEWLVSMVNSSRAFCIPLSTASADNGINISPNAAVVKWSDLEVNEYNRQRRELMSVAEIPVASKSRLKREKAQKGEVISEAAGKKLTAAALKATRKTPLERKTKKKANGKCMCGCGGSTGGYFVPGHDARFKGWLKRLERGIMKRSELPKLAQTALAKYKWVKKDDGVVPTKNYKGETIN